MPQLDPRPWFPVFLMTWTIMSGPLLFKILTLPIHAPPVSTTNAQQNISPWNWPWP